MEIPAARKMVFNRRQVAFAIDEQAPLRAAQEFTRHHHPGRAHLEPVEQCAHRRIRSQRDAGIGRRASCLEGTRHELRAIHCTRVPGVEKFIEGSSGGQARAREHRHGRNIHALRRLVNGDDPRAPQE
jgi:hypothetical protein